jgi:acetyltransferase
MGAARMLGEVRASTDPDNLRAEFAIMVRSDLKGLGLGRALLAKLIRYLKSRGTGQLVGECLRQNDAMAALARSLGFGVTLAPSGEAMSLALDLQQGAALARSRTP